MNSAILLLKSFSNGKGTNHRCVCFVKEITAIQPVKRKHVIYLLLLNKIILRSSEALFKTVMLSELGLRVEFLIIRLVQIVFSVVAARA